jgi:hypothetical protein
MGLLVIILAPAQVLKIFSASAMAVSQTKLCWNAYEGSRSNMMIAITLMDLSKYLNAI